VGSRHIAITDMGVYDAVNAATRLKYEPYDYSGAAVAEASALGTATLRPCWPRASMTAHRLPPLPVRGARRSHELLQRALSALVASLADAVNGAWQAYRAADHRDSGTHRSADR
jgi:hypothetical protein